MRAVIAGLLLAALAPLAAQAKCACAKTPCADLAKGVTLEGVVVVRKGAWMLKLDKPTCFRGTGEEDDIVAGEDRPNVRFVQLAPDEKDLPRLEALKAKRARLTGDAFGAHTRHHLTEALLAPAEYAEAK